MCHCWIRWKAGLWFEPGWTQCFLQISFTLRLYRPLWLSITHVDFYMCWIKSYVPYDSFIYIFLKVTFVLQGRQILRQENTEKKIRTTEKCLRTEDFYFSKFSLFLWFLFCFGEIFSKRFQTLTLEFHFMSRFFFNFWLVFHNFLRKKMESWKKKMNRNSDSFSSFYFL